MSAPLLRHAGLGHDTASSACAPFRYNLCLFNQLQSIWRAELCHCAASHARRVRASPTNELGFAVQSHRYQNGQEERTTSITQEEAAFVAAELPAVAAANWAARRDGLTIWGTPYNGKFTTVNFDNEPHVDKSDDNSAAGPIIWYHHGGVSTPPASDARRPGDPVHALS